MKDAPTDGDHLTLTDCHYVDPLLATDFAAVDAFDLHLAVKPVRSAAIDAGDPASGWANEPKPNGGRVNLGFYGNTAEAATSRSGMMVIVR